MKLDRNLNEDGLGKYALIKLRISRPTVRITNPPVEPVMAQVQSMAIDFGDKPSTEFFVIRLKDKYAAPALRAYADAAQADDPQWANEVHQLANRAECHPDKNKPD